MSYLTIMLSLRIETLTETVVFRSLISSGVTVKETWRKKTPAMQDIWRTDTYPPLGILPLALDQYYVSFHEGEFVVIIGFTVVKRLHSLRKARRSLNRQQERIMWSLKFTYDSRQFVSQKYTLTYALEALCLEKLIAFKQSQDYFPLLDIFRVEFTWICPLSFHIWTKILRLSQLRTTRHRVHRSSVGTYEHIINVLPGKI